MTAQVLVLCGPSGSGKTRLADRLHRDHGWPVFRLDDFYKEGDDPTLPRLPGGSVDWDALESWCRDDAVAALVQLCRDGAAVVPTYDTSKSAVTGTHTVDRADAPIVIAEGIFAADIIGPLREHRVLFDAVCVHHNRWITFARRLIRDLSERRKSPPVLFGRGLRLARSEPQIVAAQLALGARSMTPHDAERHFADSSARIG